MTFRHRASEPRHNDIGSPHERELGSVAVGGLAEADHDPAQVPGANPLNEGCLMTLDSVVWVLGAGFSKPLGAPLLPELLGPRLLERLQVSPTYQRFANNKHVEAALRLYNYGSEIGGLMHGLDSRASVPIWTDAEDFLDQLEQAAREASGMSSTNAMATYFARLLKRTLNLELLDIDILKLADAARRLLAIQCELFLEGTSVHTERWAPYVRWMRQLLQPGDTIITFNYDRVVEMLNSAITVPLPPAPITLSPSNVAVLKLHGSTDWLRTGQNSMFVRQSHHGTAPDLSEQAPEIAVPGPNKQQRIGEFKVLWEAADEALRRASAIVFIGYRFPPSDAAALQSLLDAISRNVTSELTFHIVLGPKRSDDVIRLEQLLRYAVTSQGPNGLHGQRAFIIDQRLFSQDFLSVIPRHAILKPDVRMCIDVSR